PGPADWDNFWSWSGPEGIVVSDIPSGRHPEWLGNSVADVARLREQDPFEAALAALREERMGVAMISFSQDESVVERIFRRPWVNACTDGLLGGRPHPRAYGTYPRILGRYVREKGLVSLEEAVRKLTSQAARAFGFEGCGLVRPGYRANLVVFDAATVADRATFEEPARAPAQLRTGRLLDSLPGLARHRRRRGGHRRLPRYRVPGLLALARQRGHLLALLLRVGRRDGAPDLLLRPGGRRRPGRGSGGHHRRLGAAVPFPDSLGLLTQRTRRIAEKDDEKMKRDHVLFISAASASSSAASALNPLSRWRS